MKKRWQILKVVLLGVFCIVSCKISAEAAVVLPTDVSKASGACTLMGVRGDYITDSEAALKRINAIRLEACKEGVINPSTGKPLKKSDYVPMKWSYDMEYVARIRAAEASVYMAHTRTNGKSPFSITTPNGETSWGEVISWNWSDSVLPGIEQWYDEKEDWVKNTGGVTGHYEALIKPGNTYVGIATFYSPDTRYPNTTTGEFSHKKKLKETKMPAVKNCVQTIEVKSNAISGSGISGLSAVEAGRSVELFYTRNAKFSGVCDSTTELVTLEGVTWKSSNPSVATIDENGIVTAVGQGNTKITATVKGKSVTHTINVLPSVKGEVSLKFSDTKFIYDGYNHYPAVTVFDKNKEKIPENCYEVEYPNLCNAVGTHIVKVHFVKKYAGTVTKTFTIVPKKTSLTSLSTKKKGITVKWKKQSKQTSGYQLQYTKDKKFKKGVKTVIIGKNKTVSKKISKLSKNKKYYVRIRTYKKVKGKNYYSSWSKSKSIKVK